MQKKNIFNPTEEHLNLRNVVKNFSKKHLFPTSLYRDSNEFFDRKIFTSMAELGLLGAIVPEEYGGSNMDILSSIIIHEELAYRDPSIALSYLAHSILCINNIVTNCSKEQKNKYLHNLCNGKYIGAMAMSESDAGSDVMSMKTYIEKKDGQYILNGSKMWITNGVIDNNKEACDIVYVYVKERNNKNLCSLLVEKNTPGFYVGQKIKNKLGMRGSPTAELVFENCPISNNNIITSKSSVKNMMRNLQLERLTLAAISVGIAKYVIDTMIKYSISRVVFNQSLYNFGQIQKYIADSYSEYMACRTYLYNITHKININDYNLRIECDSIKLLAGKMAKKAADLAIQILGGNGYIGEFHVERFWRDAKLIEIGGGTNEVLQKNIVKDLTKIYK